VLLQWKVKRCSKRPTPEIERLIHGEFEDAKVFRKYARNINNAVSMSSLKTSRPEGLQFSGVIFEGKIYHLIGPRDPNINETPKFAQLYIHDSADELVIRYESMFIPVNTSNRIKETLKRILEDIVSEIKQFNPFVRDFKMLRDIPSDRFAEGKIVISAKRRPQGQHERVYNEFHKTNSDYP
jgi:hypothetical protein